MARSWPLVQPLSAEQIRLDRNRDTMGEQLVGLMQECRDLLDKIELGTATAADQRRAIVICLHGFVRLTRLHLGLYDRVE